MLVRKRREKEGRKNDLEAIANGDYGSIAGVWQDDEENKLVFNDEGLPLEGYGASLDGLWNQLPEYGGRWSF